MKKLKLSFQNMEGVEVLTREQLKKVMGGSGCAFTWTDTYQTGSISIPSSDSIDMVTNSDGSHTYTVYGTSMSTASGGASNGGSGAHWCCDSCSSASWYHPR